MTTELTMLLNGDGFTYKGMPQSCLYISGTILFTRQWVILGMELEYQALDNVLYNTTYSCICISSKIQFLLHTEITNYTHLYHISSPFTIIPPSCNSYYRCTFLGDDAVAEGNAVLPLTVLEEEFVKLDRYVVLSLTVLQEEFAELDQRPEHWMRDDRAHFGCALLHSREGNGQTHLK